MTDRAIGDTDLSALAALARKGLELAQKATSGPWKKRNNIGVVYGPDCIVCKCGNFSDAELRKFNAARWNADADFIAFARANIEALAEGMVELEKMLSEADDVIHDAWSGMKVPERGGPLGRVTQAALARHAARQKGNTNV